MWQKETDVSEKLQSIFSEQTMEKDIASSAEMSIPIYQNKRRHIPLNCKGQTKPVLRSEGSKLQPHCLTDYKHIG